MLRDAKWLLRAGVSSSSRVGSRADDSADVMYAVIKRFHAVGRVAMVGEVSPDVVG